MKKLIILLGIVLLTGISTNAQINNDTAQFTLVSQNIIDSFPRQTGWVNDFENIYSKKEIKTLDSLITDFEKNTGYEIAIVTVDGSLTTDTSFDAYILKLARIWKVGKKGKNNGMVIGISSEFRSIRIVNGDGVVLHLSDNETKNIIDTVFIPNFKEGNYFKGTKEGLLTIMEKLK